MCVRVSSKDLLYLYYVGSNLNEIQENRQKTTNNRLNAAVTTDVLALIPIKHGATGSSFIEFGGSLQSNKREYFGPVNVTRLRVRLMDDKGNIVNLEIIKRNY